MGKGRRYNGEQKLNMKKVFAVIITIIVIIMFFIGIKNILKKEQDNIAGFTEISYFTAYDNGKWGVINSKGENIVDPIYEETIIVPNNKKDIFLCMYDVNYTDGSYKTKVLNSKNEEIFTTYTSVEALANYDSSNNTWYVWNALKVQKDGKYGLINLDGNEIIGCEYDKIDTVKGIKNSILIQKDEKLGIVNATGNIIIEPKYIDIKPLTNEYTDGYIVKNSENNYGVIGINKNQILECKYSDIKQVYGNNMYIVKENGKWKIINSDGTINTEISYDDVTSINNDNLIVKNNNKFGIIGTDKTEKAKVEYQELNYIFSDYYVAKKDGKFGVINSNNEIMIPLEYTSLLFNKEADCIMGTKNDDGNIYFSDRNLTLKLTGTNMTVYNGYIRMNVDNTYKIYNLKFEEKSNREAYPNNTLYVAKNDGKYGLVNKDGTLVVQYQYDDITEQNKYGYVAVKKDGKWGVIDQYGNVVVDPKYNLGDINKIEVIGKWHLAENVNMTYYICE